MRSTLDSGPFPRDSDDINSISSQARTWSKGVDDVNNGVERIDSHSAFVAVSDAMREVRRKVEQVAAVDVGVLLLGESGTGKEVVARMIHKLSRRAPQKFLKVNCAALPVDLLESELFGYEAGAFTGAHHAKPGKFETCHKGTILMDEIAEMPISPQAKLLHVLQDGTFSRLGSTSSVRADVRILAATNVDVHEAVRVGTFRADLYYRLNVFTIHLPPLRERKEDLPCLLNHFMAIWSDAYARQRLPITQRILDACTTYPWPGNVRELESFVKRYLVHGSEIEAVSQLGFESRLPRISTAAASAVDMRGTTDCGDLKSLVRGLKQETERAAIVQTLVRAKGNKQLAAKLLRISLRALQYKVQQYGLGAGAQQPYVIDADEIAPVDLGTVGHRLRSPMNERHGPDPFDA